MILTGHIYIELVESESLKPENTENRNEVTSKTALEEVENLK